MNIEIMEVRQDNLDALRLSCLPFCECPLLNPRGSTCLGESASWKRELERLLVRGERKWCKCE